MRLRGARRGRLGLLASIACVLGSGACASVDRGEPDECRDDSDCGTGSVCSFAQGNICVPEELPPQAAIGFELRDGDLRIELAGCDPEVTRELGGSELRVQKRGSLLESFAIRSNLESPIESCATCLGVCDEDELTCAAPSDSTMSLAMESRLGLSELRSSKKDFLTEPPPPEGELPAPATFEWPRYESDDPKAHSALILEVAPPVDAKVAPYRRVIAEDAGEELTATAALGCQRSLFRTEGGVATLGGSPVVGANIEFVYAEPIATPSTVIGSVPSCEDEEDCPRGWACSAENTCGLDLTGVVAGSTASTEELAGGYPFAYLYTYCEDAEVDPLLREFIVRVTPPETSGLPNVSYTLSQQFSAITAVNSPRQVEIDSVLCLPDWQPPQDVAFAVSGSPVALTETELGVYSCCSTSCLPSTEAGVEPTPPPSVESCAAFGSASFETRWFNPDLTTWLIAGCMLTATNSDGSSGRYGRVVEECPPEGCTVALTPGEVDDLNRNYSVAIVQPPGSVLQSKRFAVQIDAATTELEPFELPPRVLLRGQITCSTTENCVATNAEIAAERLRVDTDEADLPGPFFFDATVDAAGNFVLPLDPGVYVITAYPAVGQPGAPSRYAVVDLREDSPLIEMVDGVPNATLDAPLELDDGILVRVTLNDFEVSTTVTPLDIGSWKAQDDFPADLYDLNDPMTCYGSGRGCRIRRVRNTDAPISLLISKSFQFTTRSRGGDNCG